MLFGKAIGIMLVLIAPLAAIANPVSVEVGIEVELFPPTGDLYNVAGSTPCCNPSCSSPPASAAKSGPLSIRWIRLLRGLRILDVGAKKLPISESGG